jgi:hypothetical protein
MLCLKLEGMDVANIGVARAVPSDAGATAPPDVGLEARPAPAAGPSAPGECAAEAFKALVGDDDAGADERVLLGMCSEEGTLLVKLYLIEHQLADKLVLALDSPKLAAALATMLRDVTRVDCAVTRRVAEVLKVANELRTRRILLQRGVRQHGL